MSLTRSLSHDAPPSCLRPPTPSGMKRSVSWGDFNVINYELSDDEKDAKRGEKSPAIAVTYAPDPTAISIPYHQPAGAVPSVEITPGP